MKRIDTKTQKKLYWLFIPLAIVVIIEMTYLWFKVNIIQRCFNIDIDILTWCKPALILSVLIIFLGYSIAALRQKCWGELIVAIIIMVIMLLNMSNIFIGT